MTNTKSTVATTLLSLLAFGFGVSQVGAVGFRLPNQDPEAIARGDAFVATADNPSAIYYNPAGITQIQGGNFRLGVYAISANTEFTSSTGAKAATDPEVQEVPQVYLTYTPSNSAVSFGLGIYAPYGLSLNYGKNTPIDTIAEKGALDYFCFNPVIAWKLNKTLSIGVGASVNYSKASLYRSIFGGSGTQFSFVGDGLTGGFNAGVLWQPLPKWSFGLNYRSATHIDYQGTIYTTPSPPLPSPTASTPGITFPQYATAGVSFRPTTNWNFEFDLDWTEWSAVQQITFNDPALGNPQLRLEFRNSFIYDFGVTRQLGDGYFASVGYIYSQNSSPDGTFNPLIPDSDLSLGSIGFGHHGQRWDWVIGYHFAYGTRTVSNDFYSAADGSYRTFNNAVNVAVGFKF